MGSYFRSFHVLLKCTVMKQHRNKRKIRQDPYVSVNHCEASSMEKIKFKINTEIIPFLTPK